MRRAALIGWSALVLVVLAAQVLEKERILAGGEQVFLELLPADPRSLMQGDYMRLRFAVGRDAAEVVGDDAPRSGRLVVRVGEDRVGRLARLDDGSPLAADERLVRYRRKGTRVRVVPDSFFFQEGQGHRFQQARYGVLVYGDASSAVLAGLADEAREPIGPD